LKVPETYDIVRKEFLAGTMRVEQVVSHYIDMARASADLNIYIEIYEEEALERARMLDRKLAKDKSSIGRLFGMVISIKDVLCYKGHKISAGSGILQGFESAFTATAVQRLLDEDAIILGRVNCDEFAMGSSNENSFYGPTRNGDDPSVIPGGSSGASAVSVQMDTCMVSLGSDTGGSVRQPASFCGVVGFKPSYGRISRYGLIAYASSFDQIGILSKAPYNIALVLSVIAGNDEYDSTASILPIEEYHNFEPVRNYRIAYFQEAIDHPSLNDENRSMFHSFADRLSTAGHRVEGVSFELLEYLVPTYYILTTAEASSNLSRYDGVRYGHRAKNLQNIDELYTKSRGEGFGLEVKRRIMLGTFVLSEGYFDAYYRKAQAARQKIKAELESLLQEYDFLMMPCTTGSAWKIGEKLDDPVEVYLSDIYTVLANIAGVPAVCIPYKMEKSTKNNYGVQFLASYMAEKPLLSLINNILNLA